MNHNAVTLKASELPMPRLELRWEYIPEDAPTEGWASYYDVRCLYIMVIGPADKLDCRSNSEDGYGILPIEYVLNETRMNGTNLDDFERHQYLNTPYRDGLHIVLDKDRLNLPAFVTYKDMAREMKTKDDR